MSQATQTGKTAVPLPDILDYTLASAVDEVLGFFGAGKAFRAGVGFRGIPRVGSKGKPCGDWIDPGR